MGLNRLGLRIISHYLSAPVTRVVLPLAWGVSVWATQRRRVPWAMIFGSTNAYGLRWVAVSTSQGAS